MDLEGLVFLAVLWISDLAVTVSFLVLVTGLVEALSFTSFTKKNYFNVLGIEEDGEEMIREQCEKENFENEWKAVAPKRKTGHSGGLARVLRPNHAFVNPDRAKLPSIRAQKKVSAV